MEGYCPLVKPAFINGERFSFFFVIHYLSHGEIHLESKGQESATRMNCRAVFFKHCSIGYHHIFCRCGGDGGVYAVSLRIVFVY